MAHTDSLQLNDLVFDFYFDATSANNHTYNDQIFEALGDGGFTGTLPDRMRAWLLSGGYTGTLNDQLYAWTGAQGEVGAINDRLRDYYLSPGPGPPTPSELVIYAGAPVWYNTPTNFVTYVEP